MKIVICTTLGTFNFYKTKRELLLAINHFFWNSLRPVYSSKPVQVFFTTLKHRSNRVYECCTNSLCQKTIVKSLLI